MQMARLANNNKTKPCKQTENNKSKLASQAKCNLCSNACTHVIKLFVLHLSCHSTNGLSRRAFFIASLLIPLTTLVHLGQCEQKLFTTIKKSHSTANMILVGLLTPHASWHIDNIQNYWRRSLQMLCSKGRSMQPTHMQSTLNKHTNNGEPCVL